MGFCDVCGGLDWSGLDLAVWLDWAGLGPGCLALFYDTCYDMKGGVGVA
jgi:hypothetical protein